MKVIQPYSPELRELKAKAIVELDKPLLAKLQEVEGEEFVYCETFLDALQATSIEDNDMAYRGGNGARMGFKISIGGGLVPSTF